MGVYDKFRKEVSSGIEEAQVAAEAARRLSVCESALRMADYIATSTQDIEEPLLDILSDTYSEQIAVADYSLHLNRFRREALAANGCQANFEVAVHGLGLVATVKCASNDCPLDTLR